MVRNDDFCDVALPKGLEKAAIRKAVEYIERQAAEWVDIYLEQQNIFSAVIGILGTKALDAFSAYEKHRHTDMAQQRFPDLRLRGSGPRPKPEVSLESKGSKRPWAIQSHYDHPGWYVVWRYLVDLTGSIEAGKQVLIWRVDVVFLKKDDWKYEKSSAGSAGGGRTHTFGVKEPAKILKGKAVYIRSDVVVKHGKPVPRNGGSGKTS